MEKKEKEKENEELYIRVAGNFEFSMMDNNDGDAPSFMSEVKGFLSNHLKSGSVALDVCAYELVMAAGGYVNEECKKEDQNLHTLSILIMKAKLNEQNISAKSVFDEAFEKYCAKSPASPVARHYRNFCLFPIEDRMRAIGIMASRLMVAENNNADKIFM